MCSATPGSGEASFPRRIVSGVRPSGGLHLGNYFGSIRDCLDFQYEYVGGAFYFIADLHEMTSTPSGVALREQTLAAAIDYLALGLRPDMVTFFVQSDVPQVSELMWILACTTPTEWLVEAAGGAGPAGGRSAALMMYPMLMAADCLALRATDLPVGADQAGNAEIIRCVARRWNDHYGAEVFPVPQPQLSRQPSLAGIDGSRMSKSAGNAIGLFAGHEELRTRVNAIPATPQGESLVAELLRVVTDAGPEWQELACAPGARHQPQQARRQLVNAVATRFAGARDARGEWTNRRVEIEDLLLDGSDRARMEATETLEIVRETVGIGLGEPSGRTWW